MMPQLSDLRRNIGTRLGPFWLYLAVAVALNAYPIAAAIRASVEYNGDVGECRRAVAWLYTNAFLCVLHMATAIYIAWVGRTLVKRWDVEVAATTATTTTAVANGDSGKEAPPGAAAADDKLVALTEQVPESAYVSIDSKSGSASGEDLTDVAHTAASAPTTIEVLKNLSARVPLRLYAIALVYYLCWTTVGLKRHMMNAGYCGGNIRGHVADSVLCAVLFLVLSQGVLCFGACRAAKVMAQGRVSGLSRPAYGIEA